MVSSFGRTIFHGGTITKTTERIALSLAALFFLTSCSTAASSGSQPSSSSSAQDVTNSTEPPVEPPVLQTIATKATISDVGYSLDKSVYGGSAEGNCVIGFDETLVCATRNPISSPKFNDRILSLDYWSRSYEGDAGTTKIENISGRDISIDRVLATPQGYLFLIEPSSSPQLIHSDTTGKTLWSKALTEEPYDLGVSDTEALIVDSTGVHSLDLNNGSAGLTRAKPGSVLAGTAPSRDGYSSFAPGTVGLSKAHGGSVLSPADIPALSDSCLSAPVPGCELDVVQYADADFVVTRRSTDESASTRAFTAHGELAWQIKDYTTSVVRFGETFAVGYAGNEYANTSGKLSVIAAHDGSVLAETSMIKHGSAYAAGITEKGVIVGFDGPGVPGSWDLVYSLLELNVSTDEREAMPAAAKTKQPTTAPGKATASMGGAFVFDLPAGWTTSGELNKVMGSTTKFVSADGKAVVTTHEGIDGIGGGFGCETPFTENPATEYLLPGINTASATYGFGAPTLRLSSDAVGRYSYEIGTMRVNCMADQIPMNAGPAGATLISAELNPGSSGPEDARSADSLKAHQEILAVLMSARFADKH